MSGAERLYTPELLSLTLELARFSYRADLPLQGNARSKSCGSTLALGLSLDGDRRIDLLGLRVQACAVGQAAAALFVSHAVGKIPNEIAASRQELQSWLKGNGPQPAIPRFELIAPAREYPARHGAIMLAWDAAIDALSSIPPNG